MGIPGSGASGRRPSRAPLVAAVRPGRSGAAEAAPSTGGGPELLEGARRGRRWWPRCAQGEAAPHKRRPPRGRTGSFWRAPVAGAAGGRGVPREKRRRTSGALHGRRTASGGRPSRAPLVAAVCPGRSGAAEAAPSTGGGRLLEGARRGRRWWPRCARGVAGAAGGRGCVQGEAAPRKRRPPRVATSSKSGPQWSAIAAVYSAPTLNLPISMVWLPLSSRRVVAARSLWRVPKRVWNSNWMVTGPVRLWRRSPK